MIQEGDKVISKDGFEARVDTVECMIFIFGPKLHKDTVLPQLGSDLSINFQK